MLTITKEPQVARFTSDKAMIKDHHFYKGDGFSWTKPARVNDKYYPYFHKQQDEHKPKIEVMKQQEIQDKRVLEAIRRERILEKKVQDKMNFESRIREREVIQKKSNQPLNSKSQLELPPDEDKVVYEIIAKRVNSGKDLRSDEFSWNKLNRASKKNVNIYLGSYSVKGEEDMIKKMKQRVEEERLQDEQEQRRKSEIHQKLRIMFIQRQEQNLAKEEMIARPASAMDNLITVKKSRITQNNIPDLHLNQGLKVADPSAKANSKIFTSINSSKSNDKALRLSISTSLEKLSVPREIPPKQFTIDSTECKGMLVQNMDKKLFCPGNNFYEALATQSKVFQEVLDQSKNNKTIDSGRKTTVSRPGSPLSVKALPSRPSTSQPKIAFFSNYCSVKVVSNNNASLQRSVEEQYQKNKSEARSSSVVANDEINTLKELDVFENLFCKGAKKIGYGRANLDEAKRLSSTQGLGQLQRYEFKTKTSLVQ